MKTKRLLMGENKEKSIKTAAEILNNGGVVAMPTETVYGLAASAYDSSAIEKVFIAKGRPQDNPLIVHIADYETLKEIACNIPQKALECATVFWPGPFTMVLKRTQRIAPCVAGGLDTVAVRMPNNDIALSLIKESGLALAAPSANSSGKPSPTTAHHVLADLDGKIDAVIMGERSGVGVESTVVSFVCEKPRLLRPGAVTLEQLKEIIPEIEVDKAVLSSPKEGEKVSSPGMKYKHYAPKCELYLVEADISDFAKFVNEKNDGVALCFSEEKEHICTQSIVYGSKENPESLAYTLFDILRELDLKGIERGYVHAPEKSGVGLAVYNRLIRACGYKVIKL